MELSDVRQPNKMIGNFRESLDLLAALRHPIDGAAYLLTRSERGSDLLKESFHVLTHELKLELRSIGTLYFTWKEEPDLNGHPIRIAVSVATSYVDDADLVWTDVSGTAGWRPFIGHAASRLRLMQEPTAYEGVAPPSLVTTGIELGLTAGAVVQITVITPPGDLATPLDSWHWSPSTVLSIGFGVPDLTTRPSLKVIDVSLPLSG